MKLWSISFQYWNIVFVNKNLISTPQFDPSSMVESASPKHMDDHDLSDCFDRLVEGNDVVVECSRPMREVVQYCMEHYRYVRAAGGVVEDPQGQRLLIYRNERWDLPKGKVEDGETLVEAALREVTEEAGMQHLEAGRLVTKTYHIFNLYGGWHLKQTSWFMMRVPEKQVIVAQEEEGITGGEWVDAVEFDKRLGQSYATLRKVKC